ncbi:MAG: 3-deoxy-manno-octulosonate cytidylyltransferase [bacterium]
MKVVAIIPARYSSARFPGKVVTPIAGKPMIQRVWERASQAKGVEEVIVATDDDKVQKAVTGFGGKCIMTSSECRSGTERCAEAADKISADIVINVQGDEPLINPRSLELLISPFREDDRLGMATLRYPIKSYEAFVNPNIVKVICDEQDHALYFSRLSIPYFREKQDLLQEWAETGERPAELLPVPMKHIGVYAYRESFLQALTRLPRTDLEAAELLEQLRVLAWGFKIKVVPTSHDSMGVDIKEDVQKVEETIAKEGIP